MKLLLDQNLSFKLVPSLSYAFPGTQHVRDFGLTGDDDEAIWRFAAENDFTIVSKDLDFLHRAIVRGCPPKIILVRLGNCATAQIEKRILEEAEEILAFAADEIESLLVLE